MSDDPARSLWRLIASERLARAGCVAAEEEADELIAASMDFDHLQALVARRESGEPLAWITGSLEFGEHVICVDPGTYVPRIQSVELARRASDLLPWAGRAVDLCTGVGSIAAFVRQHRPDACVIGVDVEPLALACARSNGVPVVRADLGSALVGGCFDVVTAIAPYVPTGELQWLPRDVLAFEPLIALDGGPDGLSVVRRVINEAGRLLRAGGSVLVEIGGRQDVELQCDLSSAGFHQISSWRDEDDDLRGLVARRYA